MRRVTLSIMLAVILAAGFWVSSWMLEQGPEPAETRVKPHIPGIITGK
jgi:hypothetical protein